LTNEINPNNIGVNQVGNISRIIGRNEFQGYFKYSDNIRAEEREKYYKNRLNFSQQ
jgi:outer membrane protease